MDHHQASSAAHHQAGSAVPALQLDLRSGARGRVRLPGSKSHSNRALLLAALGQGPCELRGLLDSDDTRVMIAALRQLGVALDAQGQDADGRPIWRIQGCAGRFPQTGSLQAPIDCFIGNSGLTIRTLLPALVVALAQTGGCVILRGVPRMHERPIADLVTGLRALGAEIDHLGQDGYPPLRIRGVPLRQLPEISVRGNTSSQFLTGLLQAAPGLAQQWSQPVTVQVVGELISRPYVDLSVALLRQFGVALSEPSPGRFQLQSLQGLINPAVVEIEGDASSASYFLAAGLLGGGPVRVVGAGRKSLQGDVQFAHALEAMGAEILWGDDFIEARAAEHLPNGLPRIRGIDLDCNAIPDAAMTLVAVALYAQGSTRLRNIGSWRVKETDRIAAMAHEARKLGAQVEEGPDFIVVHPPAGLQTAAIETYDDHRVAMSFALASFAHPGDAQDPRALTILDPNCVAKTFPTFFDVFARVCAEAVPVIAIDGPTASGKGTVAARVAAALGWHYLDSGALYRLVALLSLELGLDPADPQSHARLAEVATNLPVRFVDGEIWLSGRAVGDAIRAEAVGSRASELAALPGVRAGLMRRQHDFARSPGLVADGRDMGSVVFPWAETKVFLTASAEVRAERRHKQLIDKGFSANLADLLSDLQARDARDASRSVAPLKYEKDQGVAWLDTTSRSIAEAVQFILEQHQSTTNRA